MDTNGDQFEMLLTVDELFCIQLYSVHMSENLQCNDILAFYKISKYNGDFKISIISVYSICNITTTLLYYIYM